MAEPKVQLVAPIGNITVPGMNVTGVVTATTIGVNTVGLAGSIIQGSDLDIGAGIITATSFVGDQIGTYRAASLTGSPDLVIGVVTASSYVGDTTGAATSIMQGTNINAGTFNATTFVGNVTGDITGDVIGNASGIGASIKQGNNLNVGIATAWKWYGDGSSLTGVASSTYSAQEVTATGAETIIDLTYGNLIYYKGEADTTVGFASTAATQNISVVRDTNSDYDISISTGGVTFDGSDGTDLSIANNADIQLGSTTKWTVEFWLKRTGAYSDYDVIIGKGDGVGSYEWFVEGFADGSVDFLWSTGGGSLDGGQYEMISSQTADIWYHVAIVRNGTGANKFTVYINGSQTYQTTAFDINAGTGTLSIGGYDGAAGQDPPVVISNLRIVKGTAVYTSNFVPPSAALTNITNTKLLCCQSDSSATTAAVTPGTITANGSPTAGAQTLTLSGSLNATITWPDRITWSGGSAPTLISDPQAAALQVFRFLSVDSGLTYNGWEEMKNDPAGPFEAWTWGWNIYGELGLNNGTNYSSPVQLSGSWSTLMTGSTYPTWENGGIKSGGTLWAWGYNLNGQFGHNNTTNYSSPKQVPGTTWNGYPKLNYGAGQFTKSDGTLWTTGNNTNGGIGDNSTVQRSSPTQVPGTTWSSGLRVGSVAKAGLRQFATKTDGTLWAWGSNQAGGLGLNQATPVKISSPTQIPGTTWRSVSAADGDVLSTKTDGTLWAWGYNASGQLGQDNQTSYSSPKQVGTDTTWADVIATGLSAAGLKTDGTLWGWGDNSYGQLGINDRIQKSSPIQVGTDTTWSRIDTDQSSQAFKALKTDGTLWSWGYGGEGAIGNNSRTACSSPVQVGTSTDWARIGSSQYASFALKSI